MNKSSNTNPKILLQSQEKENQKVLNFSKESDDFKVHEVSSKKKYNNDLSLSNQDYEENHKQKKRPLKTKNQNSYQKSHRINSNKQLKSSFYSSENENKNESHRLDGELKVIPARPIFKQKDIHQPGYQYPSMIKKDEKQWFKLDLLRKSEFESFEKLFESYDK